MEPTDCQVIQSTVLLNHLPQSSKDTNIDNIPCNIQKFEFLIMLSESLKEDREPATSNIILSNV